jgi:transposase-like protein
MPKGVPTKKYSGEFKQAVVEAVRREGLSYDEAGRRYGITGNTRIARWERIYLEEGAEGLYIERRGRASAANGVQKGRKPQFDKKVEEDLIAEN